MDSRARTIVASCLVLVLGAAVRAEAQLDLVSRRRAADAFDSYDLRGGSTFDAIETLDPNVSEVSPILDPDLRLDRARAALDVWLLARIDPRQNALSDRLAASMTLPAAAVPTALREELTELDRGERHAEVAPLLDAISLAQAIDAGGSMAFDASSGVRRDALLVVAVGRALADGDDSELAAMMADPCDASRCPAPFDRWAAPSRVTLRALSDASGAIDRIDRAWRAGDPFARAVWSALTPHRRRLELHVHSPAPQIADRALVSGATPGGAPAHVTLLVAVTGHGEEIVSVPPVRVRHGRIENVPPSRSIEPPLPGPPPPGIDRALVARLRRIEVAPDAVVAVGATPDAPPGRLQRVLASMVQAQRAPSAVVQEARDGSLRTAPIEAIGVGQAGTPGDVVVHLRPGGLRVTEALAGEPPVTPVALGTPTPGRRLVLDATDEVPPSEIVQAAFAAAEHEQRVAIVRE